ncbi:MAG: penicillin-binding protein 2 [Bacteroidota bacterium]
MDHFRDRRLVFLVVIALVGLVYLSRLFWLQVIDKSYEVSAENNSQSHMIIYPARGLIYDRNGELLVYNQAAYDIMVIPGDVQEMDTLEFCNTLSITPEDFRGRLSAAREYSPRVPSVFMKQVAYDKAAVLQEKLFKYPGFYVQTRTLRTYPRQIAAHVLGYVGEVDKNVLERDSYYQLGDYIGVTGIEKSYELQLRGKKGKKIFLKDVHNRIIGAYEDGQYDQPVIVGKNLTTTIDANLQEYGEKLMRNFTGSMVAIEPSSGEVLALISSPAFPPSMLVGRNLGENFIRLSSDTMNPLFNRALMAQYPPGSTFKTINGLIGLQEGVINQSTSFGCEYGYHFKNISVGCHSHASPLEFSEGLSNSCNSYFCNVFRRIMEDPSFSSTEDAFSNWRRHVTSFGLGSRLGSDFTNELSGNIPTVAYYDKYYRSGHWNFLTIISLAIGQGELLITPLQMANMTAAIANHGYFYTPHIVRAIEGEAAIDPRFTEKHYTTIDSVWFPPVITGMELAVNGPAGGTARIARMNDIIICGKTGTAQNPHGDNHSIFIAFAPKDDPKIAIAVYVENEGSGATWAAPMASLMIEQYLTDTITRGWLENYVLMGNTKKKQSGQEE